MGFRCELCDDWLNVFQFSHLCNDCYKIRTILKCYNKHDIVSCLENNFLVSKDKEKKVKQEDIKFQKEEEARLEKEFNKQVLQMEEQTKPQEKTILETINEDEEKDLKELKKNKSESDLTESERNEAVARNLMSQMLKVPVEDLNLTITKKEEPKVEEVKEEEAEVKKFYKTRGNKKEKKKYYSKEI
tara:strand:- start:2467 stop:3027 length:561 start_codon:yes stop_codon:yes gene_type:complete